MKFESLTIRTRLLLLSLGLIVPLAAAGFFNLWSYWQVSRTQIETSLEQQAQLAALAFEEQISAHRQTMMTISILAAANKDSFTLKEYMNSVVETRPNWLDLQIVNRDGEAILAQSRKPQTLQNDSVKFLKDQAERENNFVISAEESSDEKLHYFSLAQPVGDGNFVVARVDATNANEVFENLDMRAGNIIAVFDRNNRLIYRNRAMPKQILLEQIEMPLFSILDNKREGIIQIESPYDKIERVYGLAQVKTGNYIVAVGMPSEMLYEPARRQFSRQAFFALLIASLAIAAAYAIAWTIAKPLHFLTRAARDFGAGDLSARTKIAGGGTLRELGLTFNKMADEITEREEQLKALDALKSEFVSSVSHELRTPLTTIKTLTRVLQSDKISVAEREEYLETITTECNRQIAFIQDLLDLSRIESGAYRISPAPLDVVRLLLETVETQTSAAISRNLKLTFNVPKTDLPDAFADAGALRQIVSSLIENAMKYTPEGGEISVTAFQKDDQIAVAVADDGCGIAAEDLPHIFEKFYRGKPFVGQTKTGGSFADAECEPGDQFGGVGLGLYLVKNLVVQSGGEIIAESPVEGTKRGAKFVILLPIKE